ncbi:MAG: serine hydrolase [Phycisphaerales bacterium]
MSKHLISLACLLACLWVAPGVAWAQNEDDPDERRTPVDPPDSRAGDTLRWVLRVINGEAPGKLEDHFSARYIEIGAAKEAIDATTSLSAKHFKNKRVYAVACYESEENPDSLDAVLTGQGVRAYLSVLLVLDAKSGLIAGLNYNATGFGGQPGDWNSFEGDAGSLGGEVSFGCYELVPDPSGGVGGTLKAVYEIDERRMLNIGGVWTLWAVGAVAERVSSGGGSWTDEVELRDEMKCLPGGFLSSKPAGTKIALATLVERALSFSDTTATDHLVGWAGRDQVEAYMTARMRDARRNLPLLTMRQYFHLKLAPEEATREAWSSAAREARALMLGAGGEIGNGSPRWSALGAWTEPRWLDRIGYFANVEDMAKTMADLHRLERREGMQPLAKALREDGGPLTLDPADWKSVAYKGGNEPGSLSQAWLMEHTGGRWYVMTLAWNNLTQPVDEERLGALAKSGVSLLSKHAAEAGPVAPAPAAPAPSPDARPSGVP